MKKIIIFVLVLSLVSCKKAVKEVAEAGVESVAKVMAKEAAEEATEAAAKKTTKEAVEEATEAVAKKTVKEVGQEGLGKMATQTVVKQSIKEGSEKGFMASVKTALNRVMVSSKNQFVKMDPMNGVLLPNNSSSLLKGTIHHGGHTKSYHDEIARRLQRATNRDECFQILDGIKDDLYKGRLSLYNELKNNTVINSFKR